MRRWKLLAIITLVLSPSFAAPGCAVVRPWERGRLAKRVMSRSVRMGEAMCERTFLEAREGATGGHAAGAGGGCACN